MRTCLTVRKVLGSISVRSSTVLPDSTPMGNALRVPTSFRSDVINDFLVAHARCLRPFFCFDRNTASICAKTQHARCAERSLLAYSTDPEGGVNRSDFSDVPDCNVGL
jgi:hypothetical protein